MKLSVIIVNYNVKYFLEQCLFSVNKALESINAEIWVVDNQSTDNSYAYLHKKFPQVKFILNSQNLGFARANNQALENARGEYVLFLNPDTILPEDCLSKSLQFIASQQGAGAMGIRMIDGAGRYLKESKRGFPTPWVALCKMSGLTRLFPASSLFAKYYLGHLPAGQDHRVEALSGAFMLVKRSILEKTGGFDERFFMYAEDIDLSFRIHKAGYQNYYFSGSTIIHFKGESTKKDKRYVKLFYNAMKLFVEKHYQGLSTRLLAAVLQAGIGLRALVAGVAETKFAEQESEIPSFFSAVGDEASIRELAGSLEIRPDTAHRIYCTGQQFSYRQAIQKIESCNNKASFYVHGAGSGSVVGSGSSKTRGRSFPLSGPDSNNQ